VFTSFHKPPYPYLYGRSVDETTTTSAHKNVAGEASALEEDEKLFDALDS
jgi:hypothetical protein